MVDGPATATACADEAGLSPSACVLGGSPACGMDAQREVARDLRTQKQGQALINARAGSMREMSPGSLVTTACPRSRAHSAT